MLLHVINSITLSANCICILEQRNDCFNLYVVVVDLVVVSCVSLSNLVGLMYIITCTCVILMQSSLFPYLFFLPPFLLPGLETYIDKGKGGEI